MSAIRILQNGQVTIPKHIRDTLNLKEGDIAEVRLENGQIVITPNFSRKETSKLRSEPWDELQRVMRSVHEKNRGVGEAEVVSDVQRAVAELRQEEYERKTSCCA